MKKFNEQQIREDYADGALDDELDALIDTHYRGSSASKVLAELGSLEAARKWALELYIVSARDAYDDDAIAEYEDREARSDA